MYLHVFPWQRILCDNIREIWSRVQLLAVIFPEGGPRSIRVGLLYKGAELLGYEGFKNIPPEINCLSENSPNVAFLGQIGQSHAKFMCIGFFRERSPPIWRDVQKLP